MGLNLRKLAAVVSAAAMLAVAGPVAVSTANAADAPAASETAAQHVFVQFNYGKGDIKPVGLVAGAKFSQFAAKVETPAAPEGKVFAGWANAETGKPVGADVLVYFGLEVYPVFKDAPVQNVTVVFYDADDAPLPKVSLKQGTAFSEFAKQAEANLKVPEGKKLVGWYFAGAEDKTIDPAESVNANGWNVYPKFEDAAKQVTVTFYTDESLSNEFAVEQAEAGKTTFAELAKKVGTPTREGKVFAGWYGIGGDVLDPNDTSTFSRNTTLIAAWKDAPVEQVTVTFHGKDGQPGWPVQVTLDKGSKFYEFQNKFDKTVPTVDGLDFVGWSKDIDHVDADHLIDSLYEVTDSIDAFPVYVAAEQPAPATVRVTFLKADGSPIVYREVAKGTLFGVASQGIQAPTVPGKVFTGWAQQGGALTEEGFALETDLTVTATYRDVYQPQPQFPWWGNWWTAFQHWWGSWNHWFNGWWR